MGLMDRASNLANKLAANKPAANEQQAPDKAGIDKADGTASQPVQKKDEVSKEDLDLLRNKISQYQAVNQDFNCILLKKNDYEKDNAVFYERLAKMMGTMGIINPIVNDFALILLPAEIDGELIAHRLSKSLNAESALSFKANSPEYVINRIESLSYA